MKYKVSMLAMMIAVSGSGAALADDYDGSNVVTVTDFPSSTVVNYGFDAAGNPLHNDQINPDGTFKLPCPGCYVKAYTALTPAEEAAVAADPQAAKFDFKNGRFIDTKKDSTTGDSYTQTTTTSGVQTAVGYKNGAGDSLSASAKGATASDAAGNGTDLSALGVTSTDAAGNRTTTTASGVVSTDAAGNQNVFTANGVTVVNTSGAKTEVTAGGASFTDVGGSNTTIAGGNVTNSGDTTTKGKTTTGSLHVKRDSQTDGNAYVGGYVAASGGMYLGTYSDPTREIGGVLNGIDQHLGVVDNRLDALEGWRSVATAQISNLTGRMSKVEGAAALAMTLQVPTLEAGKRFGLSADFGGANSTGAFSAGAAIRLNDNWQLHGGGGAATNGQAWGGRVGVTGQW